MIQGPARFRPGDRLHKPEEFKQVFANGKRTKHPPLAVVFEPNGRDTPRLGLAIAKKVVPLSVGRNRIKRIIRNEFRLNRLRLPPVDLVFYGQPGLARLDAPALRTALADIWTKVIERCARSSSAPSASTGSR